MKESVRANVIPNKVEKLQKCYWRAGQITMELPTLIVMKKKVKASIEELRPDHLRTLNPTPYKVNLIVVFYRGNDFMLKKFSKLNKGLSVYRNSEKNFKKLKFFAK